MRKPHVSSPADQPAPLRVVGEEVTVFAAGEAGKPFEVHLQRGVRDGGPPPHQHPWDEAFYIIEGEVELTIGETSRVLPAGSFVHIPAATVHAYRNVSETATMLGIVSDPRGGELFAAIDANVAALPADLDKLLATSEQYGVEWQLPPAAP